MAKRVFSYGEDTLDLSTCLALGRGVCKGVLSVRAKERIAASAEHVQGFVRRQRTVYGVNTGFGHLCHTKINKTELLQLQENLLKSHSTGVGRSLDKPLVRLMILLKVHALARGHSGVSLAVVERLVYFLEEDLLPRVPEKGSLGASGDLAPLSHLSLPLIGLGELWDEDEKSYRPAMGVLRKRGKRPVVLAPKDGLALINGTQFMVSQGVWGLWRLYDNLEHADLLSAMSVEAFMGSASPFDARLHQLRPHAGGQFVARRMACLWQGSQIMQAHADCKRVQDPYSFRCIPQVHGASWDAWVHARGAIEIEMNAVTDNPVVWDGEQTLNGGNFHGQPIALPFDYVALAAAELGSIAERRIYQLSHGAYDGVPTLLTSEAGLHSGFMILQYTAAALVSENKVLAHPASVDSIPTSLGQEDHVSMGAIAARKLNEIASNVEHILSIELLFAAQAISYRRPLRSGAVIEACHKRIREGIAFAKEDRCFYEDIEKARDILRSRDLIALHHAAEKGAESTHNKKWDEKFRLRW